MAPWVNALGLQLQGSYSRNVWNVFVLTGMLLPIVTSVITGTSIKVVEMGCREKLFTCATPKNN